MNQKAVGEYLKRLRIRARYTQTDVASYIGVTDKVISRWESGAGMPEISNLLILAKLFEVTVDDILNCNEKVFSSSLAEEHVDEKVEEAAVQSAVACAEQNNLTVEGAEVTITNAEEPPTVKSKTLSNPSSKFRVILLFAYLIFGTFLSANIATYEESYTTAFCIIFAILVLTSAIINLLSKKLPRKAYYIVEIVLNSLMAVSSLVMIPLLLGFNDYKDGVGMAAAAFGVFALLFVMQLLYVIYDFCKNEKAKKVLNFCALGTALAVFVLALSTVVAFKIDLHGRYYYNQFKDGSAFDFMILSAVFTAAMAVTFALAQVLSKWINVLTAVATIPCAVICVCYRTFDFEIMLVEMPIGIGYWAFNINIALGIAIIAVLSIIIGWFFEGTKANLTAVRIVSAVAVAALIPFTVMTIDAFAVNTIFGLTERALSVVLKIVIIIAAVLNCVKAFRFDLIFQSLNKRRKAQ